MGRRACCCWCSTPSKHVLMQGAAARHESSAAPTPYRATAAALRPPHIAPQQQHCTHLVVEHATLAVAAQHVVASGRTGAAHAAHAALHAGAAVDQ